MLGVADVGGFLEEVGGSLGVVGGEYVEWE